MRREVVASNFLWRFAERCGAQTVTIVVSIVLARLLDPVVYGTVSLVSVFTVILQVFVDSGLGSALIQKKNADDVDFSTVFYFNLVVCVLLYFLLFAASPFIASFYGDPALVSVIRTLGLVLIISGVKNVQQAYVSKNMLFKKFFFSTLGGTICAATIGIWMAYVGFGVWALIAQNLINQLIDTIILWCTVKWRPKLAFSWKRLKGLLAFGWKLLVSGLLNTVYGKLRQLIIGKIYSAEDLAFYSKGELFPSMIVTNISSAIDSVLFPTMSEEQDHLERLKLITRRSIAVGCYILMPLMMGFAVCAEPIIRLLLTEKWMPSLPYVRIFCITYAFHAIHTANLNAIQAMGRSDFFLKLEIAKKIVGLLAILGSVWFGVIWMARSLILTSFLSQLINAYPNKKLLNYGYFEQLQDITPGVLLCLLMGAVVYPVSWIGLPDIVTLLIQIPLGVAVYILGSVNTKNENYFYLLSMVKPVVQRLRKQ